VSRCTAARAVDATQQAPAGGPQTGLHEVVHLPWKMSGCSKEEGRRAAIYRHVEGDETPLSECLAALPARDETMAALLRICRLSCFERTLLRFGSAPQSTSAEVACLIVVSF
jgi:hypothetical protein